MTRETFYDYGLVLMLLCVVIILIAVVFVVVSIYEDGKSKEKKKITEMKLKSDIAKLIADMEKQLAKLERKNKSTVALKELENCYRIRELEPWLKRINKLREEIEEDLPKGGES